MHYPIWLKRILLPYEFSDHPLYSNPDDDEGEDESLEALRDILGDDFVDDLKNRF